MKTITFRHMDKFAIKRLLLEIGERRLTKECELKHLPMPRRVRMFYLEHSDDCTVLKYKYNGGERTVMKIDEYELPEAGWVRTRRQ